ncbi:hypothetical protein BD413DRAFT_617413 [Trametes elegans]|nr:hypothetical protein BD413DRAFT_617413 [Trametes elegans]
MSFASSSTPTTNDPQMTWRAFPAQISGTPSSSDAPPLRPTSIEKSASGFARATSPLSIAPSPSLSYSWGRVSDLESAAADFRRQDGAAAGLSFVDHASGVIRGGTPTHEPTHEADGGVRLAGGPPVPVGDDSAEDPSAGQELPTLPPPYRVY